MEVIEYKSALLLLCAVGGAFGRELGFAELGVGAMNNQYSNSHIPSK